MKSQNGEKSNKCNQCDFASSRAGHLMSGHHVQTLDMMSEHDIDSISEDGLSPLTHIADLTHEDYNFIVLKHFTHPGCFPHQPRPFYTFLYLYL